MTSTAIEKALAELAADWEVNRMSEADCQHWLRQFSGNETYKTVAFLKVDEFSFADNPFTGDDLYYIPPALLAHCSYPLLYAGVRDFADHSSEVENFFLCHAAYLWRILNSSGTVAQRGAFGTIGQQIEAASGLEAGDDDADALRAAMLLNS